MMNVSRSPCRKNVGLYMLDYIIRNYYSELVLPSGSTKCVKWTMYLKIYADIFTAIGRTWDIHCYIKWVYLYSMAGSSISVVGLRNRLWDRFLIWGTPFEAKLLWPKSRDNHVNCFIQTLNLTVSNRKLCVAGESSQKSVSHFSVLEFF